MKTKAIKLASLITALLVAVALTVGYVFAWILDRKDADLSLIGSSAGAYFDSTSGDGTAVGKEFIISNPTHMRNLAILQNTGRFEGKKYYFKIKDTVTSIDMSGIYIPPIGNDKDPFIGDFNGNGKTLANLKVTTDKSLLKDDYPTQSSAEYEFSQAVGLFGMTGNKGGVTADVGADEDLSNIHNLIMENPTVNVSGTNTLYSTAENSVVGIAVGHVAGKCSSIGVKADTGDGAALDVQVSGYSTFNSILGNLGEGVESSVTGGGHVAGTGGSGASFGSSFDVNSMLARLNKIEENKASAEKSFLLPDIDNQSDFPVPASGAKMPFSIDADKSTYEGARARESVSAQNVGYFLGNQNKFVSKNLKFGNKLNAAEGWNDWTDDDGKTPAQSGKVPMWFYTNTDTFSDPDTLTQDTKYNTNNTSYKTSGGFNALTQEEFDDLPQGIKDLLPSEAGNKSFTPIRISQTYSNVTYNYGSDSNDQWSYHGQISWMGKTYGEGFRGADGKAVDIDGNEITSGYLGNSNGQKHLFNAYTGGIALPNCAIWFKPSQVGKFRFVMYADKAGEGFTLLKYKRVNADKNNPFKVDPDLNGGDLEATETIKVGGLPSDVFFYYEHEVSQAELDAGNYEYVLMQYGNGGAYFIYLDLGASAAEDTSAIVPEKEVSAVDFIYDGVRIAQDGDTLDTGLLTGDFIVKPSGETWTKYESSKTSVYFENMNTLCKLVFIRLYSGSTSHTDKTKTICLEQSTPVPDTASEVKATYATYVCPTIGGGSGTVSGGGGTGGGNTGTGGDETGGETITPHNFSFKYSDISAADQTNLTQEDFGADSFIKLVGGNATVQYRSSGIDIRKEALSVTFQGTGTITISAMSTNSTSNVSSIALKAEDGTFIEASIDDNVIKDDNNNYYAVTGNKVGKLTFTVTEPGTYIIVTFDSVMIDGTSTGTARNTRIVSIEMIDNYVDSN